MKICDLLEALSISNEEDVFVQINDPDTNIPYWYDIEIEHQDATFDEFDDDLCDPLPASVILIPKELN